MVLAAGAASGIGATLVRALAERGAHVTVADLDTEAAQGVAEALPGDRHAACALDIRDEASCQAAVASAQQDSGRLDLLLNSVGIFRTGPALELSGEDFAETMATNVTGAFLLSRHAARAMADRGGGRMVHIASVSHKLLRRLLVLHSTAKEVRLGRCYASCYARSPQER